MGKLGRTALVTVFLAGTASGAYASDDQCFVGQAAQVAAMNAMNQRSVAKLIVSGHEDGSLQWVFTKNKDVPIGQVATSSEGVIAGLMLQKTFDGPIVNPETGERSSVLCEITRFRQVEDMSVSAGGTQTRPNLLSSGDHREVEKDFKAGKKRGDIFLYLATNRAGELFSLAAMRGYSDGGYITSDSPTFKGSGIVEASYTLLDNYLKKGPYLGSD